MRHRLAHFSHIFSGGYSAGYYAYTWAEVMEADGFQAFKEADNIFDPAFAANLRREMLERVNTRDPGGELRSIPRPHAEPECAAAKPGSSVTVISTTSSIRRKRR